ncbi:MAG TPA: hypothetical protein VHQ22_19325 [Terriglobales bacterium]|nr:hypothetical protein [Terriglobales bacterium]
MAHSADPVCEKVHRDGCLDALVRAAEDLGQRRLGVVRMSLAAWDASAAVRRDALADECLVLQLRAGGAEKLAVRELACLALDGSTWVELADPAAVPLLLAARPLVLPELDKPGVGRSAAQSCAVPAFEGEPAELGQRAFEPVPRFHGFDLGLAMLVAQEWRLAAQPHELPEEQQAQHLRV